MRLLAIETSCDETAAALVTDGCVVESSVVASQIRAHAPFGGVVPELAARMHLEQLAGVVSQSIAPLQGDWGGVDVVAVTRGPGLVGCLIVGVNYASGLASGLGLPLVGVNHMLGHVLAARVEDKELEPPFIALVVSGGHTDLVHYRSHQEVRLLGATRDDAVGEAFDKVARMLGLPYPGGPEIDRAAQGGDPRRFALPRPVLPDFGFSFSGLKTAVLYRLRSESSTDPSLVSDMAASFRAAAVDTLLTQLERALEETGCHRAVIAGGVACNELLRTEAARRLEGLAQLSIPAPSLCTDNAAMIGAAALTMIEANGLHSAVPPVDPALRQYV